MIANLLSSVTFKDMKDAFNLRQLKIATQSNLSLCYLKLSDFIQCKKFCDSALALDSKNEKCLFRRAQCQVHFNNQIM